MKLKDYLIFLWFDFSIVLKIISSTDLTNEILYKIKYLWNKKSGKEIILEVLDYNN